MQIFLGSEELDIAIKEYIVKRGMDPKRYIGTRFIGGRKGNGSTAYVELSVAPVEGFKEEVVPKVYEGINKQLKSVEEEIAAVEEHFNPTDNSDLTEFEDLLNSDIESVNEEKTEEPVKAPVKRLFGR